METWIEITYNLEQAIPMIHKHEDTVSLSLPGYTTDFRTPTPGRGFTIIFQAHHLAVLQGLCYAVAQLNNFPSPEAPSE